MTGNNNGLTAKLLAIQQALEAPKDLYNSFGKYKYRSAESILKALKPLLDNQNCVLKMSDEVINVGDRNYVMATVTLVDAETCDTTSSTAYACEPLEKKGMDASQITGASSSYARKYALCGMFAIDDGVDNDKFDNTKENGTPKRDDGFKVDFKQVRTKIAQCTTQAQLEELWHSLENPETGKVPQYVETYLKEAFTKRKEEL